MFKDKQKTRNRDYLLGVEVGRGGWELEMPVSGVTLFKPIRMFYLLKELSKFV